ncbi:cytochrome b5 reductase family protein [Rhodotorula paludigena]|uniref:cytochrome b5 reductase family protein n=1 Tax=Rhodotorula paludigena TaxID=86838 RepID=UPI00317C5C14
MAIPRFPAAVRKFSLVSGLAEAASRSGLSAAAALVVLAGGAALYYTREEPAVLSHDRWTSVKIKSVTPLTPETSLFKVEVPRSLLPPVLESDPTARPILSLFVKEPNLQIQRAYTPLSASSFNSSGPAELGLVIKRYADGEASRYIHRLGPGDELSVRGPSVTWYYRPQDWDEVVFVVGGTGVTPAYQLIHDSLASPPSSSPSAPPPSINVVYASPSPSRILLKDRLDSFAASDPSRRISLHYLVDMLDADGGKASLPSGTEVGFIDRKKLERYIGRGGVKEKRRMVIVCGPEGMINVVAGPRGRNFSQGPVGGILKELGYTEREVLKL